MWTAVLAERREDFEALISPIYRYADETPSRIPLRLAPHTNRYEHPHVRALGGWRVLCQAHGLADAIVAGNGAQATGGRGDHSAIRSPCPHLREREHWSQARSRTAGGALGAGRFDVGRPVSQMRTHTVDDRAGLPTLSPPAPIGKDSSTQSESAASPVPGSPH